MSHKNLDIKSGFILRKIFHFTLTITMIIPLYSKKIVDTLGIERIISMVDPFGWLLIPGYVYALIMVSAAVINAIAVKKPVSKAKIDELRMKAKEALPIGEKIDLLIGMVENMIERMEREYEKRAGYFGLLYGTMGICASYMVFGNMVLYGILTLATLDVFSSIVGTLYGKRKIPYSNATIEGSTAGFAAYIAVLLTFTPPMKAFVIAFTASLAEVYGVEDNLSIPFFTSMVAWILKRF